MTTYRFRALIAAPLVCAACTAKPASAPLPNDAIPVHASFDATWQAAIDVFAQRHIPIKNMDRASGDISSDPPAVGSSDDRMGEQAVQLGAERKESPGHHS